MNSNIETFKYDNRIVRAFAIATIIFGLVGFSAGLLIACQLFFPELFQFAIHHVRPGCVHCTRTP